MTYQIKGGKWVILYCDCSVHLFIMILLLCTGDMCRVGVYIRGRVKNLGLTKRVKKKYIFV